MKNVLIAIVIKMKKSVKIVFFVTFLASETTIIAK